MNQSSSERDTTLLESVGPCELVDEVLQEMSTGSEHCSVGLSEFVSVSLNMANI
jgi:hypothetical protein